MADIIQTRRDTAANWTTTDPILANGEIGLETDTNSMKVGNGVDSWTVLPYFFITVKTFLDLTDTPLDYTGQALKSVLVKATEDGLEFGESGGGVFVGPVPPTDKVVTPIWFNTNTGKTLTWYEDADSKQWVQDVGLTEEVKLNETITLNQIESPPTDPVPDWSGRVLSGTELDAINIVGANPEARLYPDGSVVGSSDNGTFTKWPNGIAELAINVLRTDVSIDSAYGSLYQGTWVWTYPIALIAYPDSVACGAFHWGTSASWGGLSAIGGSSSTLRGWDTSSRAAGASVKLAATATGRWKA